MNKKTKLHNRITPVLAVIIVVATIYALMAPAITMIKDIGIYCGYDEHEHGLSCYTQKTEEKVKTLTCQSDEDGEHKHSDECYVYETLAVDADELRCDLSENENHKHTELCYGVWELVCGYREHTHTLACQSNPESDVETPEEYGNAVSKVELIGLLRDDVIAIAESQLGYAESTKNFKVAPDQETKLGYTRYGEWYGDKYGEWSGMFVSFCLNYARIENSVISYDADHERRITDLKLKNLYHNASEGYKPRVGDLVFFDLDKYDPEKTDKRIADRVGFVYELIYDETKKVVAIKVIEGDVDDRVSVNEYNVINDTIVGYGEIPERNIIVSLCDCGVESDDLMTHKVECARKSFAVKMAEAKSAKAISKLWNKLPEDVQSVIDVTLADNNVNKYDELTALLEQLPQISEKTTSVDGLDFSLTGPFQTSMEANVSGIDGENFDNLKEYLKDTENHLASGAYDISVIDGNSKAYFDEPIKVAISGLDLGNVNAKNLRVKVYHLVGVDENGVSEIDKDTEVEMMYATLDEEGNLCFETEDFSVFYFTVDFHYEDLTYVINGYASTTLGTLFERLELPFNCADALKVEFSNPEYISVSPIYNVENVISDWELSSLAPFTTKETLTIVFSDGSKLEIDVTDSQVPEYTSDKTVNVNVNFTDASGDGNIVVTLYKNGVSTGKTITVNSSTSWKGSFTDLESGTYSVEYVLPNGYKGMYTSGSYSANGAKSVNSFQNGKTYVIATGSNVAIQNDSSTTVSATSISVTNGSITSPITEAMKWYYDGKLKNVKTSKYFALKSSTTSNITTSSSGNNVSYSNGKISQVVSYITRYLRYYNNGFRSATSSNATTFVLYEVSDVAEINYEFLVEKVGYNPKDEVVSFEHNKEIDYLNDGTVNPDTDLSGEDYYRIYLDMTGKQEPMDLLFIVDGSGSMTVNSDMEGGMRRDAAVTEFLNGATNKSTSDGFLSYFLGLNSENMISIVQFYGGVSDVTIGTEPSLSSGKVPYTHDSKVLLDWTGTNKFVNCAGKSENGTNYEAGLRLGTDMLASTAVRGNGHRKIVIFLSDGVPTFFQVNINDIGVSVDGNYTIKSTDVGKRFAHGYSSEFSYCKDTSKTAFDDFIEANPGVTVFTIGVSKDISESNTDASQHPEVLQYMADNGGGEFYSVESDMHELKLQLETIFYPSGVVIEDKLSKYVRYYDENPDVIVTMTNKDTNVKTVLYEKGAVTSAGEKILTGVSYKAGDTSDQPSESTGTVTATFSQDYQFLPNYTYEISFNVKSTETAYKEYAEEGYNATGDENTDYGSNTTSSLKPGFHSNDKAMVSYKISTHTETDEYRHPVVQVGTEEITVKKEWDDGLNADLHEAIQVQLTVNYTVDGVPIQKTVGDPITLSANNGWTYTFRNLAKYNVISPYYEYTVQEIDPPEGYTTEYRYVNNNGEIIWVVVNKVDDSLLAQKIDSYGDVIPIAGITFELYSDEGLTDLVGTFVTDSEGKFSIEGLVNGNTYWLVETQPPSGYKPMGGPQSFVFKAGGVDADLLVNNKYLSVDKDGVLLVKNYPGYELPDTGSSAEAVVYGSGIVLILGALFGCVFKKKRSKNAKA